MYFSRRDRRQKSRVVWPNHERLVSSFFMEKHIKEEELILSRRLKTRMVVGGMGMTTVKGY